MATDKEARLFTDEILQPVGEAARTGVRLPKEVTGFLAMEGHEYQPGGLMVIGRAVNGWTDCIRSELLSGPEKREEFSSRIQSSVNENKGKCPMAWVTDQWGASDCYNTRRSPLLESHQARD